MSYNYQSFIKNIIWGLIVFLFSTHVFSFFSKSFQIGVFASLLIILLFCVSQIKNIKKKNLYFSMYDLAPLTSSLVVAVLMYSFDQNIGQADSVHLAISSTLAKNYSYPPLFPPGPELDFSFYHYGVDILSSSLSLLFKLSPWEACSISIAVGAFLCINSIYLLIRTLGKSNKLNSFVATVFITFISSINAFEYFIREFWKFDSNFLVNLTKVSTLSVTLVSYQLRYFSQNFSLGLAFFLLVVLFENELEANTKNQNIEKVIPLFLTSFVLYLCFPAYWYPLLVGSIAIAVFKMDISWALKAVTLFVSKLIPTGDSITSINDYKITVFKPSLEWVRHVTSIDLQYFFSKAEFLKMYTHFDRTTGGTSLNVPLFSELSFREFGFVFIIGLGIFIYRLIENKKIDFLDFFIGTAIVSLSVPFLIEFPLRQIEMSRFITWGKFLCLIYIVLFVLKYIDKSKALKISFYALSFFFFISSVLTIVPDSKIWGKERFARIMDPELKQVIKDLSKLHKPGQIAVDNLSMYKASDLINLSGFYGVGAQLYHTDLLTRDTIIKTASPKLLKELKVKYILINDFSSLDPKTQENLLNNLKLVKNYSNRRFLFEVEGPDTEELEQDYQWLIGCNEKNVFLPIRKDAENFFSAKTKAELLKLKSQIKPQIAQKSVPCAYWLSVQAAPLQ